MMRRLSARSVRLVLRRRLLLLAAAAGLSWDSPLDPASVSLTGGWFAPNAYSGCSITLDLVEANAGTITGSATSVCPAPGPVSAPVTGTRSGATFQLTFPGVLGAPEHAGRILDEGSLRLDSTFPDGVHQIRFTRGIPEGADRS
jgi:hypothetical protein